MGPCLFCGRPAVHRHHLTGRPAPGLPYFDPDLVMLLCSGCHSRLHVMLRRLGLEWPATDALHHRLMRLSELLHQLADYDRGLVLDPSSTRALGGLLLETVRSGRQREDVA